MPLPAVVAALSLPLLALALVVVCRGVTSLAFMLVCVPLPVW